MTDIPKKMAQECIAVRMRMLNRVVTNMYDDALRPFGLKISQSNILVALANMKLARPSEIGDVLQIDASTLSRNLDRMKSRGWIESVADNDGRAQPVRLTSAGHKMIKDIAAPWEQAQQRVHDLMGDQFVSSIQRASQNIGKLP